MWCRGVPYILQMGEWAGRWIFSRAASAAVHGGVDEHRDVEHRLRLGCETLHIGRIPVGHELLIAVGVMCEDLAPC